MPHECTGCGRLFEDGSKQMLGGCPSCGGKKFQFRPKSGTVPEDRAQTSARTEVVDEDLLPEPPEEQATEPPVSEQLTSEDEPPEEAPERTLAELREELDDQFESIKILEPGQYELNLMGLYDRETYIISLQEDGRYIIDVPESWHKAGNRT